MPFIEDVLRVQTSTQAIRKMYLAILIVLVQPLISSQLNGGDPPVIQEIFVSKNLNENATAKLICSLAQGENVRFAWYLNDRKLTESSKRKIRFNEDSSDLVIKSLSVDDIGLYQCDSNNEFGSDRKEAHLYFNGESSLEITSFHFSFVLGFEF